MEELSKIVMQIKSIRSIRMFFGFARTLRENEKK